MPWNKDDDDKKPQGSGTPPGGGTGGPWGQGPKVPPPRNPWGNNGGNRGPGNQPPDLEKLLKGFGDMFGGMGPRTGGGIGVWAIPLALLVAFWTYNSIYQVQPDERGMVLRLGSYTRNVGPGLHFVAWPIEKVELLRVAAENQISIGDAGDEGLMLTGDENIVDIRFKVLWKIADPEKFLFNIADQQALVRAVSESAMREIVGRTPASEALTTGRLAIQDQVTEIVQRTLDQYNAGIFVSGLALEGVDPPGPVLDAFEEVQRAKQNQQNLINQAEQYTNKTLRNAEGQSAKVVEDAKGYKAQAVASAKGEAQRFEQIYSEYAKAKDVTRERLYLETMEKVLGSSNRVIIDQGKGGQGVVPYLPLPALAAPTTPGTGQ
jgi:membrane protease subunit HflK